MRHFKGFTLIELFTYILLITAVSYVAYLSYKPNSNLEQLDLKVNNLQQLSLALQSYQSIYGYWPDESSSSQCSNALEILKSAGNGNFIKNPKPPYTDEFKFSCETDILASPLKVAFQIPEKQIEYFSRFIYKLEISYNDSNNPESLTWVSMTVPSVHQNVKHFIVPAQFGGTFHVESDNVLKSSKDIEIEEHSAMVRIPESCNKELPIDFDFFSNGLCTHRFNTFYVNEINEVMEIKIKAILKNKIKYFTAYVELNKNRMIDKIDYKFEYCKISGTGFNCSENKYNNFLVLKVTPTPELNIFMEVKYRFGFLYENMGSLRYNFSGLDFGKEIEKKFLSDKVLDSFYKEKVVSQTSGDIEKINYEFNYHYDDLFKEQTSDYYFSTCEAENRAAGFVNSIVATHFNYDAKLYAVVACQIK